MLRWLVIGVAILGGIFTSFAILWLWRKSRRRMALFVILVYVIFAIIGFFVWQWARYSPTRNQLAAWVDDPSSRAVLTTDMATPCPGAPFRLPSKGFVGFLYDDHTAPYTVLNPHPGVDIFGDGDPGTVPVYAAYDGYLTRLPSWISAVIIRIPRDPLDPSRQIWNYYTHMASESGDESYISADFPPGTSEKFVQQGTLLGYQGLYNGTEGQITMHIHFSVVLSDSSGSFRNETILSNTLDPSPYFGLNLHAGKNPVIPVQCGK